MKKIDEDLDDMLAEYLQRLEQADEILNNITPLLKHIRYEGVWNARHAYMYPHSEVSSARLTLLILKAKRMKEACQEDFDPNVYE